MNCGDVVMARAAMTVMLWDELFRVGLCRHSLKYINFPKFMSFSCSLLENSKICHITIEIPTYHSPR